MSIEKRVMENGLTVCGKRKWETILILLFIMSYVIDTEKRLVQMNTISTGNS